MKLELRIIPQIYMGEEKVPLIIRHHLFVRGVLHACSELLESVFMGFFSGWPEAPCCPYFQKWKQDYKLILPCYQLISAILSLPKAMWDVLTGTASTAWVTVYINDYEFFSYEHSFQFWQLSEVIQILIWWVIFWLQSFELQWRLIKDKHCVLYICSASLL